VSCSTRVVIHGVDRGFAYGAVTRYGPPFQAGSATSPICNSAMGLQPHDDDSHNPTCSNACKLYAYMGLGCFPFARHY
jgi:hypothetical protein